GAAPRRPHPTDRDLQLTTQAVPWHPVRQHGRGISQRSRVTMGPIEKEPAMTRELVYFADPMCSWCYGFAPVISAIEQHFRGRLPLRLVMGGLRAGHTRPMRDKDKDYIREAWTRVKAASGQPFDFSFLEREGFVYDTEPACRAVVTMRLRQPSRALAFMERIQSAFYAENRDVTSREVLSDLAAEEGEDREAFAAALLSPEARN